MGCACTHIVTPEGLETAVEEERPTQWLDHAAATALREARHAEQTCDVGKKAVHVHDLLWLATSSSMNSVEEKLPQFSGSSASPHRSSDLPDVIDRRGINLVAQAAAKQHHLELLVVINCRPQKNIACTEATQRDAMAEEELPKDPGQLFRCGHAGS